MGTWDCPIEKYEVSGPEKIHPVCCRGKQKELGGGWVADKQNNASQYIWYCEKHLKYLVGVIKPN